MLNPPQNKAYQMEYIYLVDRTMTTKEDERSDFDTGECETGMFHPQLLCNFYWGGMGWTILKSIPHLFPT